MLYRIINKIFDLFDTLKFNAYLRTCISRGLKLGKDVVVRNNVSFGSEPYLVEIEDHSRIASGVQFITHSGATRNVRKLNGFENVRNFGRIKVGKNCALGTNAVILQDVKIGDNCILGANSVLSVSMPSNTVFSGNPAKYICEIEDYAEVLRKSSLDYPIELEDKKIELEQWLKKNLVENFKPSNI